MIGGAAISNAGPNDGSCEIAASDGPRTTYACRYGPVEVKGYEVRQEIVTGIPRPPGAGHITAMDVELVDPDGTPVPIQRLMLHHIAFSNMGRQDATCPNFELWDTKTVIPGTPERFYAAGEERAKLALPPGYGYNLDSRSPWLMAWMFMNHRGVTDNAIIEYHVTVDTSADIADATPYWLDVRNCSADPVYNVPGNGGAGATDKESATWTVPTSGRILGGGGHVHGGGESLVVTQPDCGDRELGRSEPTWGLPSNAFYHVKPVLHEPGPIAMSYWGSLKGIPVTAGEQLKLTSTYDNTRPHTRVMGIMVVYIAPDASSTQKCAPLPDDRFSLEDRPARPRVAAAVHDPAHRAQRQGPRHQDRQAAGADEGDGWVQDERRRGQLLLLAPEPLGAPRGDGQVDVRRRRAPQHHAGLGPARLRVAQPQRRALVQDQAHGPRPLSALLRAAPGRDDRVDHRPLVHVY